jgi:DNA-binding response OmpR family regulator
MDNRRVVLICDTDLQVVQEIQQALEKEGYEVETIDDATQLLPRAQKRKHGIILVNPDLPGFNDFDTCKKLMKEMGTPLLFLIEKNTTTRAQIADCNPDDVITKPVQINNLINLIDKHVTITGNVGR